MEKNYILTKEQFEALKKNWKQKKSHSAAELIVYNVLRGCDPKRGFTPITRESKLTNGHAPYGAFERAKHSLRLRLIYGRTQDLEFKEYFKQTFGQESSKELLDKLTGCV